MWKRFKAEEVIPIFLHFLMSRGGFLVESSIDIIRTVHIPGFFPFGWWINIPRNGCRRDREMKPIPLNELFELSFEVVSGASLRMRRMGGHHASCRGAMTVRVLLLMKSKTPRARKRLHAASAKAFGPEYTPRVEVR